MFGSGAARHAGTVTTLDRVRLVPVAPPVTVGAVGPVLLAAAAALVRLPFLLSPLTSDEGGFLVVAGQWSPGPSLYGAYFVDRPPLLLAAFAGADALGGALALRLLGLVAVVVAVLLAGRIGGTPAAAVAAVFLSSPLLGVMEVDGELLAAPLVLGSFLLVLRSVRADGPEERYAVPLAAGALAVSAALVKQDLVDGFVVAAVLLVALARTDPRGARTRALSFLGGALGALGVVLLGAASRGTGPLALWDAVVTFRVQAAGVISTSASSATSDRLHELVLAAVLAGLPLVAVGAVLGRGRPVADRPVLVAAVVVLAWEVAGALLGGSYWHHYLIALVPGLVLLVAACDGGGRLTRVTTCLAAMMTAFALVWSLSHPPALAEDQQVAAYVRSHARPTDTVVVAFGHGDVVRETGLMSPYPYLWSLPVRVRDPRLTRLDGVLAGPEAPRWLLVAGDSLSSWGLDADRAQSVVEHDYREVWSTGDWRVLERSRAA